MSKKFSHPIFGIGVAAGQRISEGGVEIVDLEFSDCKRTILLSALQPVDESEIKPAGVGPKKSTDVGKRKSKAAV